MIKVSNLITTKLVIYVFTTIT